ncbi:hypothetical protein [Paracoccus sp. SCSIO 75233]|uniref:hypothetical protein n=1 Tax=Paracoccus sp. SCSIO 75233 TaxID=3017782 RepID=UPI0022F06718|nr:hypothetical protein [Paracoccus sp. SCSIO 75233]WBU52077.1 hypothetical protein PAF12_09510 [Paracoccus sp. SCSIO 75233]
MIRLSLAAFLLATFVTQAAGQGIQMNVTFSCADWSTMSGNRAAFIQGNFLGLLDGLALGHGRDFWLEPYPIDAAQASYWMDQYCEGNPLNYIVTGAYTLMEERLGKGWNVPTIPAE